MNDKNKINELDGIEALKDLNFGTESEEGKGEDPSGAPQTEKPAPSGVELSDSIEKDIDALLQMADGYCISKGLTPLTPLQKTLTRTGLVGVCKKYNLTLNLDEYPEIALAGGVAWIVVDKSMEIKKLEREKTESGASD